VRSLEDLLRDGVQGRYVLLRADLNVPLEQGRITDDGRIRAVLPTLRALCEAGARVVVVSHLGRPQGIVDPTASLRPVADRLHDLTSLGVVMAADVTGASARTTVQTLADGAVAVLENVRFDARETSKDPEQRAALAAELAALVPGGAYVQDAFGAVHRAHASVTGVPQHLPAYAGQLVATELDVLRLLSTDPARPYVVVLGGSKVSDKLAVIRSLLPTVDTMLVGGGMCFTFLAAQGHPVGASLLEADQVQTCRELLEQAAGRIVLPVDIVAATAFAADAQHDVVAAQAIPPDRMGLDIGPDSVRLFAETIAGARTIFWNGPMGVFELAPFAHGTAGVLRAVADSSAFTVVGGGDSAAALRLLGPAVGAQESDFGHISTGGGASLEFLQGRDLPGLAALAGEHDAAAGRR
jgi:phosphoglycerate kinase